MGNHKPKFLAGVLLVGVLLLAACGGSGNNKTTTGTNTPSASGNSGALSPTAISTLPATSEVTSPAEVTPGEATPGAASPGEVMPGSTTPAQGQQPQSQAQVVMTNNTFQPAQLQVVAGTTVTWTNQDSVPHTVTAGTRNSPSGLFDSGNVDPGGTFSFTFTDPGTYDYFCSIHPNMDGTITVTAAGG
jgi:plastocyanin